MNELDKHHMKFERPHIYECTCGVVAWLDPGTFEFKIDTLPSNIEYLECGHAKCAATETDCIICRMTA